MIQKVKFTEEIENATKSPTQKYHHELIMVSAKTNDPRFRRKLAINRDQHYTVDEFSPKFGNVYIPTSNDHSDMKQQ